MAPIAMLIAWRRCSSLYAGPVWSESERVWSMFLFDFLVSPVKVGMLPSKVRYLDLEGKVNSHPQIFLPKWELQHHLKLWKISGRLACWCQGRLIKLLLLAARSSSETKAQWRCHEQSNLCLGCLGPPSHVSMQPLLGASSVSADGVKLLIWTEFGR